MASQPPTVSARRIGWGLFAGAVGLYLQIVALVAGGLLRPSVAGALVGAGLAVSAMGVVGGLLLGGTRALGPLIVPTVGIGLCVVLLFVEARGGGSLERGSHSVDEARAIATARLPAEAYPLRPASVRQAGDAGPGRAGSAARSCDRFGTLHVTAPVATRARVAARARPARCVR